MTDGLREFNQVGLCEVGLLYICQKGFNSVTVVC